MNMYQTRDLPNNINIHPIWEIPEKITKVLGLDIDIIIIEPRAKLDKMKKFFGMNENAVKSIGATFCQDIVI